MDSRPYPSWWRERAARRHQEIDKAVVCLREAMAGYTDLDGALIFGSFARNETGPESDLDLIIVQRTQMPIAERGVEMRKRLYPVLEVAFDLIVYTPEEYCSLQATSSFVQQAVSQGIWIDAHTSG